MSQSRPKLLGPWRRLFQWSATLLLILLPFLQWRGQSLLRLDLVERTGYFFGLVFRMEELYLVLLFGIALVFGFLLITLMLGRAWCGWACPQTSLTDLAEGFARLIGVRVQAGKLTANPWQRAVLQLFYLAVALLFGSNLVWYFISPYEFFPRLTQGDLGPVPIWTLAIVGGCVYFDLAFVRRLLCLEFCPYGRFQTALIDPGTLTLRFHPDEAERCIRCGACVRACPVGIDIRRGYQVECINCGRCLDACREVMARRNQPGIIRYTFGTEGHGPRALLNPRMALVLVVLLLVSGGLVWATAGRKEASLKIFRSPAALVRTVDEERAVNFFRGYLTNHTTKPLGCDLILQVAGDPAAELKGQVNGLTLEPGERRTIDFAVVSRMPGPGGMPALIILTSSGRQLRAEDLTLLAPAGG